MPNDNWVVIAKSFNSEEAASWRDLLISAGIDVEVIPEIHGFRIVQNFAPAAEPYKFMVPAEQEEVAKQELEIIKSFQEIEDEEVDEN